MNTRTAAGDTYSFEAKQAVMPMLLPGEELIHLATVSGGIYWKSVAMALAGCVATFYSPYMGVYFFIVAGVMAVFAYLTRKYLLLAATDRRVIMCGGIVNQEVIDLRHDKIESVELLGTLPGMLCGYAGVILAGTGRARIIIPFIEDAVAFRNTLTQMLLERQEQK